MHKIIAPHKGEVIGMNLERPADFKPVLLVDVNESYLTLEADSGGTIHYSMRYVIFASEGDFSLLVGVVKKKRVALLVQVYQFVVYSGGGSVGVGVAF